MAGRFVSRLLRTRSAAQSISGIGSSSEPQNDVEPLTVDDGSNSPGSGAAPDECVDIARCSFEPSDCVLPSVSSAVVEDSDQPFGHRRHRRSSHHHRHSPGRRHHHFCRIKWKEVNFMAAMSSVVAAVLVCTSLADPHWWYISGGDCRDQQQPRTYLGVRLFFYEGLFVGGRDGQLYYYGSSPDKVLIDCVTREAVFVIKTIIALCFLVILFCATAIVLDIITSANCFMKALKQNAVFSILAVCFCIVINCLSYVVTQQLATYYEGHRSHTTSKVDVEFSLSFYMIVAAGIVSVFAVAFSLLCRRNRAASSSTSTNAASRFGRRRRDDCLIQPEEPNVCASVTSLPPPYRP